MKSEEIELFIVWSYLKKEIKTDERSEYEIEPTAIREEREYTSDNTDDLCVKEFIPPFFFLCGESWICHERKHSRNDAGKDRYIPSSAESCRCLYDDS